MNSIEIKLSDALQKNEALSVKDFGGLTTLYSEMNVIGNSPLMDEFFRLILDDSNNLSENEILLINEILICGFSINRNSISIKNAILILSNKVKYCIGCYDTLITLTNNKTLKSIDRAYYLLGAFEISLNDPSKKYFLIGFLAGVDNEDDPLFLTYVAKITGLCYSLHSVEDLFKKLEQYVLLDKGEDDAIYETAMAFLQKAFNASNSKDALENFLHAQKMFEKAFLYGREDAQTFSIILQILYEFISDGNIERLKQLQEDLNKSLTIYNAWDRFSDNLSWVKFRHSEIVNWHLLSNHLAFILNSFKQPGWFEPILVIEKYLLVIYDCSRSILKRGDAGGLEILLRPIINKKFIEQADKIYLLEKWIDCSTNPELLEIATKLRLEINLYKTEIRGNDLGTVDLNIAATVPSLANLSSNTLSEFDNFIITFRQDQTSDVSVILKSKFEEIVQGLNSIESYKIKEVKYVFDMILWYTLRFLELRMNNTAKNHPSAKYLFETDKLPLEDALQKDYHDYIHSITTKGNISLEKSDIAGGRADVFFEFLSFSFCAEVKRELSNASFESLRNKFLGQAKEYLNTNVKVGVLLVLDLVKKNDGIGSLESNVKLEITSTNEDPGERGIVIVKVPGNRITPSNIKIERAKK